LNDSKDSSTAIEINIEAAAVLLALAALARHPYSFYLLLRWICCAPRGASGSLHRLVRSHLGSPDITVDNSRGVKVPTQPQLSVHEYTISSINDPVGLWQIGQ